MRAMFATVLASILFQSAVAHGHPPPDITAEILSQALSSTSAVVIDCSSGTTCTFDVDIDGTTDFTMSTTGLTIPRTSNPCYTFGDSDTTDSDANAQICVQCTDTGSGTEDCDLTISQQIAGTMTDVWELDADAAGSNYTMLCGGDRTVTSSETNTRLSTSGANKGPCTMPRAGTIRSIFCSIANYSSTAGSIPPDTAHTCTANADCIDVEIWVNSSASVAPACTLGGAGVASCSKLDIATTFAAGDYISLAEDTLAGQTAGNEIACTVWGTFE